ncbi:MAG: ferritin-like domain-containing protein [Terriglobia bacterium]
MSAIEKVLNIADRGFDRRKFLGGVGAAGLGAAAATLMGGSLSLVKGAGLAPQGMGGITDADILNFALNLEYLEAEFYTVATTGKTIEQIGIPVNGSGNLGPTTGGHRVPLLNGRSRFARIAEEIAYDEQQHVLFLRSALNGMQIAKPAINLDALGIGFRDIRQFLTLARAFEDTGVSAYGGAAPLIADKTTLGYAAQIAETESLHSGNIRLQVAELNIRVTALDALDVLPPPAGTHFFTVNSQALAVIRTPSQVLAIVYGNSDPGTSSGGFFPDGVNGNINTV